MLIVLLDGLITCVFSYYHSQVPTATTYVENAALNKCLWHQTGHHIAVGDDLGKVHLYDIGEVCHLVLK